MAGLISHVTNHATAARARLLEQFKRTNLGQLLDVFNAQVQELEDALWQLWTDRRLEVAAGAQLDVLGRIVGQPREGRSDADYRPWILARIRANRSSGRVEDLVGVLRLLVPTTTGIRVQLQPPAGFTVTLDEDAFAEDTIRQIAQLFARTRAGGVKGILEYMQGETTPATAFTLERCSFLARDHAAGETVLEVLDSSLFNVNGGLLGVFSGALSVVRNYTAPSSPTHVPLTAALGAPMPARSVVVDYAGGQGLGCGDVAGEYTPLLPNGGFEHDTAGVPDAWEFEHQPFSGSPLPFGDIWELDPVDPYEGSRSLKFKEFSNGWAYVRSPKFVPQLDGSGRLRLVVRCKSLDGINGQCRFDLRCYNGSGIFIGGTGLMKLASEMGTTWTELVLEFNPVPGGTVDVNIEMLTAGGGTFWVDGLYVDPPGEPALLGSDSGGMLAGATEGEI